MTDKNNKDEDLNEEINSQEKSPVKAKIKKDKKSEESTADLIAELNQKIKVLETEKIMAYADADNLRKRWRADHEETVKYRSRSFLEAILPSLDIFEMALGVKNMPDEVKNWIKGFEMVHTNLVSAMESEGVKQIVPKVGDEFDSYKQQVVDTQEDETVKDHTIVAVRQKGYMLHDRVLRVASVDVAIHPVKKEESTNQDNTENEGENK